MLVALTLAAVMIAPLSFADPGSSGPPAPTCTEVARPLVTAVPQNGRAEAERLLGSNDVLSLTEDQAGMLLGERKGRNSLASALLGRAISRLEKRRDDELTRQVGGWSISDADELGELLRLEIRDVLWPPTPFLFRAVRGFEGTGAFMARECGDTVEIAHGSLGHIVPPPTAAAVIVFLHRKPAHVRTSYSVIE